MVSETYRRDGFWVLKRENMRLRTLEEEIKSLTERLKEALNGLKEFSDCFNEIQTVDPKYQETYIANRFNVSDIKKAHEITSNPLNKKLKEDIQQQQKRS